MGNDLFLTRKTAELCREHFPKQTVSNLLMVRWGKTWKSKLGHIKPLKNKQYGSLIEVNLILSDPRVPEFVVDATLLHELIHYFQGFGSNHPQKYKHPHRGGAVEKELERFGWKELAQKQDTWINKNFARFFKEWKEK